MRKSLYFLLFVLGCGGSEQKPEPLPPVVNYIVRCPLTATEATADTVQGTSFYYSDGALKVYKRIEPRQGILVTIDQSKMVAQFPGTCVIKEITQ